MVSKNTQHFSEAKVINMFSIYTLILLLCINFAAFSQTITDVFPIRITTGSKITVLGSGFQSPGIDITNINITGTPGLIQIQVGSGQVVSDTELSFEIGNNDQSDTSNGFLQIDGINLTGANDAKRFTYLRPTLKAFRSASDFRITEVFTNWDYNGQGYYRSNWYNGSNNLDRTTWPNDSHDLLAFTIAGVTYSTGVDDGLLDDPNSDGVFTDAIPYTAQNFEAYSSNGVTGFPHSGNFLLMADLIDGVPVDAVLNTNVRATAYDVMIDSTPDGNARGLDMGTGVANFNKEASIRFFSGNGDFGTVSDPIPDLLITQIAQAGGPGDVYYYANIDGEIVGTPIRLIISRSSNVSPILYKWQLDIYRMDNSVPYELSYPTGPALGNGATREFRMAAFKLSDFGIDNNSSGPNFIGSISNIIMQAGGSADLAFMAYNKAAFAIKSPNIDSYPVSRYTCIVPSAKTIEFNALGSVDSPTGNSLETITYQWYKDFDKIIGATSDSYTIPGAIIDANDLGNYKVRVQNGYGAVDLPVTLKEGGTPTFWNGTQWIFPNIFYDTKDRDTGTLLFPITDADRNLIFSADYSENVDLVGCDCRVLRERTVTIPASRALKLYDEIIVEELLTLNIYDVDGNVISSEDIPAGIITFGDDSSLLQTKAVVENANSGDIKVQRDATLLNTYDYIYWSSPVANFNIGNIPGTFAFQWSVNTMNSQGNRGDWDAASGFMHVGKGYIKRVISSSNFTTVFTGTPNNGAIDVDVFKSIAPAPAQPSDRHWNLIGNPYPSAINALDFINFNTNLVGFVNLWTRGDGLLNDGAVADPFYDAFEYNYADEYLTHNGTGSTPPSGFDGKIASGQGFFVQVLDGSPATSNVTFNNAMRHDGANGYDNNIFFRSSNPETTETDSTLEKQLIWLGLVNESNASSVALVGYVDGATDGVDRMYDAPRNGQAMSIYSVLEDTKMTIQGRSYPFDNADTVPLGVDLLEDGIYKIAIDTVEGSVFEDETQGLYLEDTYLSVVHDLRATPYSFAGVTGTTQDRFVLRYTADEQLSVAEQNTLDTFIYVKDDRLYVKSATNMQSIVLYDLTGKQIVTYKLDTNVSRSFNTSFQYPRGGYIAMINLENNTVVGKKLIN